VRKWGNARGAKGVDHSRRLWGQRETGGARQSRQKAPAFIEWHEADEARVLTSGSLSPGAYSARRNTVHAAPCPLLDFPPAGMRRSREVKEPYLVVCVYFLPTRCVCNCRKGHTARRRAVRWLLCLGLAAIVDFFATVISIPLWAGPLVAWQTSVALALPVTIGHLDPAMPGQDNWRWCNKCQTLSFAGNASPGTCAAGGLHNHAGSGNHVLAQAQNGLRGQDNWRCNKCQEPTFAGSATMGA
jgi:hypothetical protein